MQQHIAEKVAVVFGGVVAALHHEEHGSGETHEQNDEHQLPDEIVGSDLTPPPLPNLSLPSILSE